MGIRQWGLVGRALASCWAPTSRARRVGVGAARQVFPLLSPACPPPGLGLGKCAPFCGYVNDRKQAAPGAVHVQCSGLSSRPALTPELAFVPVTAAQVLNHLVEGPRLSDLYGAIEAHILPSKRVRGREVPGPVSPPQGQMASQHSKFHDRGDCLEA